MVVCRETPSFERFAVVGYKDDTGIGRQCHNMKTVLQIGFHLVSPSTRLQGHVLDNKSDRILLFDASPSEVETLLNGLQGVVVIERSKWNPNLFEVVKKLNKILILVPNWEWFDPDDECYRLVDLFVVHSWHTLNFLTSKGYRNVVRLTPPVDLCLLPRRTIKGRATMFFHNAGIIDRNDRKGTFATMRAWQSRRGTNSRLVVRYQKSDLRMLASGKIGTMHIQQGSLVNVAGLYKSGHCAIQPSRLEGLGYMVLEPILCGIPTITTDLAPMNEWRNGTICCRASISNDKSLPEERGIGSAALGDVDVPSLGSLIEALEDQDLTRLSRSALELRKQFRHADVRREWIRALDDL